MRTGHFQAVFSTARLTDTLTAITAAAAAAVPAKEIGPRIGMTPAEWRSLLRGPDREAVKLAIATGRAQAQLRVNVRLIECSRLGNTEATLYILRYWHNWDVTPPRPFRRRR